MDAEQIVHDVAERVRAIVTDAEERAAEIVREAEEEAGRIRARAEQEGAERLEEVRRALDELQGRLSTSGASAEVDPGPVIVPEPEPPAQPDPGPVPVPEPTPDPAPAPAPPTIPEPTPPPDEGTPPAAGAPRSVDAAAARLVAMNLALEGASRDDIVEQLTQQYELDDPGAVADDVLALAASK